MANLAGQKFGNYSLLRLLGAGGFADVYLGEHIYLTTWAAIKILQTRLEEDEQEHFLQEARIIARLIHPNIVRVLEYGVEGDMPFLVMDYAQGGNLRRRYPKGTCLPALEILPYLKNIASALQYAHSERVIHRDIKPENMLIGYSQEVLLSDFGIALIAQSTHFESTQEVYGTATYMAPEQIQGKAQPASDQYAQGVVLYEWLCGDVPFHGSFPELCSQHLFASPPSLQERVPAISAEIEAIVSRMLAKDPGERFPDVGVMAEEFEKAVHQEPLDITETEPTVRRAVPILSAPSRYVATLRSEAQEPEDSSIPPTQPVSRNTPKLAALPALTRRLFTNEGIISRRNALIGLSAAGIAATSGLAWYILAQQDTSSSSSTAIFTAPPSPATTTNMLGTTLFIYKDHTDNVQTLDWSPNGQYLVSGSADTTVRVWNALSGETLYVYQGHSGLFNSVFTVSWSATGRRIASAGDDKTVQIWDAANGNRAFLYTMHTARVLSVAWSPDSRYMASGSADKTARIWEANTGVPTSIYGGHTDTVYALAWSPDGKFVVTGSADRTVQIWEAATGKQVFTYTGHSETVYTVAWSPDGKSIASGGGDRTVQIWEAATGKRISMYDGHHGLSNIVTSAAWSPDGKRLVSASTDQSAQIWEAATGKRLYTYDKHSGSIYVVKWSFDGLHIASGSADGTVRVWQAS